MIPPPTSSDPVGETSYSWMLTNPLAKRVRKLEENFASLCLKLLPDERKKTKPMNEKKQSGAKSEWSLTGSDVNSLSLTVNDVKVGETVTLIIKRNEEGILVSADGLCASVVDIMTGSKTISAQLNGSVTLSANTTRPHPDTAMERWNWGEE